jgi:hypothetical protein
VPERYREERGISSKVVSVDSARRNTHTQERAGVSNGPYRTRTNPAGEAQTKKITQGGTECAPFENKSEQFAQLLQAFQALTPDERNALLKALGGAVESLQPANVDRWGKPPLYVSRLETFYPCDEMTKVVTRTVPSCRPP